MKTIRLATLVVVLTAAASAAAANGVDGGAPPVDAADAAVDATPDGADDAAASAVDAGAAPDANTADAGAAATVEASATLRGRVLEKGTRRPLPGAAVTIDGAPAGETDAAGKFDLRVAPGRHHVQIQIPGHDTADRPVDAIAGGVETMEPFRLAPRQTGEVYETVVRPGRTEIQQINLSGNEARTVAGTSNDPLRVIASLPGVQQIVWPASIYVVRGANPGNTGFYLDGVRVPALFHIALGPSAIHPYLIAGVDFYPGGYPASYSGFVSGIMAARTVAPPADRVHASVDVTVYDAGGIVTAPWDGGRGTVAAAARYSYTGALFSALSVENTLRYGDYQLRADHPLAGGQATVFAFGSLDELGWVNINLPEFASLQFHRLDLRWRRAAGGGRLLIGNTLGADWSSSTLFDRPIKVHALSEAPRIIYDRTFGPVDAEVGADGNVQSFVAEVPDFGRQPSDLGRTRKALSLGAHATLTLHLGRLTVSPGVRGDLFAEEGVRRPIAGPRLDVALRATDSLTIRASGGRFAQMPSLPVSVAGFEAFGLADYGLQTSLTGSLGVETTLPRGLTLGVTGYAAQLRLTDVRDIDIMSLDPGAPDFLVSRRGRAYGAELLLRKANSGRLYGWLAYTLSWSLREDDSGVFGRSDWDQRHILNLVAGYRLRGGYSVGARIHFNTGRHAPIIGSPGDYQDLPAFYQLDLRAERRFVFDKFTMSLFADFANTTLTREVVQVVYDYDPNTGMRGPVQRDFHLILPTIGIHAEL
ncbi:MAG TPA: carboxypeptidase regulatory-like domain-containing protein [Polyangia bacterium]|jgi:hypothetical protein